MLLSTPMFCDQNYRLPVIDASELDQSSISCTRSTYFTGSYGHLELARWTRNCATTNIIVALRRVEVHGKELETAQSCLAKIRWHTQLDRRKLNKQKQHQNKEGRNTTNTTNMMDRASFGEHLLDIFGLSQRDKLTYLVMEHSPEGTLHDCNNLLSFSMSQC